MRDRIKTNKRLLHSQSLLSLAVGTSPDTILVTRLSDGCILDVNEGFVRNTGYSREEAVGRSTRELNIWTNDESRESFVLVLRRKGVCRNFENSFRTRDGRIIAGLVSAQIIDIEGEACVFAVSRAISDLKYAQEALFKSEEHFRSVVESLAEALIITDEHGVTRYANARVTELTGYEPSHLLGNRAHESLMHPDDWPDMRKRDEQRLQGHSETYEVRVFRRNGSWFWAEVHAAPCRNAAGEIIGTLGALTDISGRRHLEAQLRQSQKMEAVGQLAAGVAHNFNNMLQVIIGSLEAALPDVAGDVKSLLVDAEKSSRRAAEIVSQLVLFAHHGRRRNFEPLAVSRVLADTVDLCRRSFDRSITLSLRPSGITATVNGDSGQLQQVFLNICLNARDALEGVEGRNPAIQIEVAASVSGDGDDQSVEIAIIDNGVGMSQDAFAGASTVPRKSAHGGRKRIEMQSTQMDVKLEAEHGVVCSFANDFLGYFGWPTLAKMDDGTLVAAASGLRNEHVCPFGRNVFCTSTDEGRTWTSMRVANDSPLDDRDTGVVCLGGDKMLLSWFTTDNRAQADRAKPEAAAVWQTAFAHITDDNVARWAGAWVCASDDAGESWKAPVKVPLTAPHGPIRLRSDALLYFGKVFGSGMEEFTSGAGTIVAMTSSDDGQTWGAAWGSAYVRGHGDRQLSRAARG